MKNTLVDLNNYLFAALEDLDNPEITDSELEKNIKVADAKSKVADKIILNADLMLRAAKMEFEITGNTSKSAINLLTGSDKNAISSKK